MFGSIRNGWSTRKARGDSRQIRFAGHAENPGDSVNQKCGRERAEDEIFHAGFERDWISSRKTNEHEERNGDELERNENENEIDRRNQIHQAGTSQKRQRKKFTEICGGAFVSFA
jgi:hypothetical protein